MNPALTLVLFYLLLALGTVLLRGDLAEWPRVVDRMLACLVCLGAVALLVAGWKPRQPPAGPAEDGSSRPRLVWPWWLAVSALVAFVFLVVLPPASRLIARPQDVERMTAGELSPGRLPPAPDAEGLLPQIDPDGTGRPSGQSGSMGALDETEQEAEGWWARMRSYVRDRPLWMIFLAAAFLLAGLFLAGWWLYRRWLARPESSGEAGPPIPWHDDPKAAPYVREFRRLCEHLGCAPRPGDTWRDLLARLPSSLGGDAPLVTAASYHYQVRYEGVRPDPGVEREFARAIRAVRKAATFPPATETGTAG